MSTDTRADITNLLLDWRAGDPEAVERLMPLVYDELRRLAHRYLRNERAGAMLQTTELVHEAYLRLVGFDASWEGRSHFFAVTARMMRNILVDRARALRARKRGGGETPVTLLEVDLPVAPAVDLVRLDDALRDLSRFDTRKGRILEMHYFGGMTHSEVADVLDVSVSTVEREGRLARAWLGRELAPEDPAAAQGPVAKVQPTGTQ